jgi:CBS domain-containing protein
MQVKEIMTDNIQVVQSNTNLQEAAIIMRDINIGVLPIADGQRITGILTERDIVVRSTAKGMDPKSATVDESASTSVAWCFEDDDIEDALQKMENRKIRCLPVVNRSNELVGIVSLIDIPLSIVRAWRLKRSKRYRNRTGRTADR